MLSQQGSLVTRTGNFRNVNNMYLSLAFSILEDLQLIGLLDLAAIDFM